MRILSLFEHSTTIPIDQKRLLLAQVANGASTESGTWMYANTRLDFLVLADDVVCDELCFRTGLPPPIRRRCATCNALVAMDQLVPTHQTACGRHGANQSAGALVEAALFTSIRKVDRMARRQPRIALYHFMEPRNDYPPEKLKTRADIAANLSGAMCLFDVRLSSKVPQRLTDCKVPGATATLADKSKLLEYKRQYSFPEGQFMPIGVDHFGCWSPSFKKLFLEALTVHCRANPWDAMSRNNVEIIISRAIARARSLYLHATRFSSSATTTNMAPTNNDDDLPTT